MARIIMADDDEIVGELVCDALIASGHGVGLLTNGADALRTIKAKRPDLVILDCNMPEMSGILVLREMRNSPELCEIPVLMLTGRSGKSDMELALYQGADDYMSKPFEPDEVAFRVDELLARRQRISDR